MASRGTSGSIIKRTIIEKSTQTLKDLPIKEAEELTLREAVAEMYTEIQDVLKRGYSLDEVAAILTQNGIEIKGTTLKQYISVIKKQKSHRRGTKPKPRNVQSINSVDNGESAQEVTHTQPQAKRKTKVTESSKSREVHSNSFIDMPEKL